MWTRNTSDHSQSAVTPSPTTPPPLHETCKPLAAQKPADLCGSGGASTSALRIEVEGRGVECAGSAFVVMQDARCAYASITLLRLPSRPPSAQTSPPVPSPHHHAPATTCSREPGLNKASSCCNWLKYVCKLVMRTPELWVAEVAFPNLPDWDSLSNACLSQSCCFNTSQLRWPRYPALLLLTSTSTSASSRPAKTPCSPQSLSIKSGFTVASEVAPEKRWTAVMRFWDLVVEGCFCWTQPCVGARVGLHVGHLVHLQHTSTHSFELVTSKHATMHYGFAFIQLLPPHRQYQALYLQFKGFHQSGRPCAVQVR